MPLVVFSHKKKQEKEYLIELLKEREWFECKKFPVFLPKDMDEIAQDISKKNELLKQKIIQLQKAWRKIEKKYFQTIKRFNHKKLLPRYICHITRFGPEGKYNRPNLLFIRLRTRRDERRALETIGHEVLHLLFADFFDSKKLNYSEREGMIDTLILQSNLALLFPQYKKQSVGKVRQKLLESILP